MRSKIRGKESELTMIKSVIDDLGEAEICKRFLNCFINDTFFYYYFLQERYGYPTEEP